MSDILEIGRTSSEDATLRARGYTLLKKLGEGSYAKVYLAEYKSDSESHRNDAPRLACKVIDASLAVEDVVEKFLPRELDILVKLNHPHIVHVHSIFQRRSKYFIFMRFAENGDLLDFILKNGPIAESQARIWFRQLALGLQYLHEMEMAHRDVKCENVLLTSNYNVKLADFGFARSVVDSRGKRVLSDTYCGSLSYAAPEILAGIPYNPKISDVWSLGVLLYIILNKRMPFDDVNTHRLREFQTNRRWKFRAKIAQAVSENVKKLVANLLEPEVSKRWRIDQAINGDWIAMDPRLVVLTPAEQSALNNAIGDRMKIEERRTTAAAKRESMGHPARKPRKSEPEVTEKPQVPTTGFPEVTVIKDAAAKVSPLTTNDEHRNFDKKTEILQVSGSTATAGHYFPRNLGTPV